MVINKLLTKINFENKNNPKRIKYIVVHYVGATGGAEANCRYFEKTYRGASSHYFVGHKGEVWQCVEDEDVAWHCGAKKYVHKKCRNSNSLGIELCCHKDSNGNWYFEDATITAAVELIKNLMKKYNVPIENVLRHWDVTGKNCPEPFVRNPYEWRVFKDLLVEEVNKFEPYLVKINTAALNVRAGAGTSYKVNTVVHKNEVYTIVSVKNGWGELKSGAGWIKLSYTKKV